MEKSNIYTITLETYKKLALLSDEIYNMLVIIAHFCNKRNEIEELRNLAPIINNLREKSDKLNVDIINLENNQLK